MKPPVDLNELALVVTQNLSQLVAVCDRLGATESTSAGRQLVLSDFGGEWSALAPPLKVAVELARSCESDAFADEYAAAVRACSAAERRILVVRGGRAGHCRIRLVALAAGGAA